MTRFPHRFVLLAALALSASLPVAAREVRLQDANGESGVCPDAAAAAQDDHAAPVKNNAKRTTATPPKGKTPTTYRGNDNSPVRAPRWHRFLPGMFR